MPSSTPRSVVSRLVGEVLDLAFPQQCLVCGRFGAALHAQCLEALPAAEGPRCARCWRPGSTWCEICATGGNDAPAFDGLVTPFVFEGDVRRALLEAKFRGTTANLGPLASAAAEMVPARWAVEVVVPVPLSPGRRRRRGFNQAELIARRVARELRVPLRVDLVQRVRSTLPQAQLGALERHTNLVGAFAVRGVPQRRVLVVDDVTTTGSTLSEVAWTLLDAGAERVYGLAVARED